MLYAVPADPKPFIHIQPDGTSISIYLKGDEHLSWAETLDGYTILPNGSNTYVYAIRSSEDRLIPSTVMAHNPENRAITENNFLNTIPRKLSFSLEQRTLAINQKKSTSALASFPTIGTSKMLIILVEFADTPFQSGGQAYFDTLANGKSYTEGGATGSIWQYYYDNSMGKLNLSATVVGPYTLSKNLAYYGRNESGYKDINAREMIKEAINLADNDVNYADFDNDHDGTVDNVYVIYAGYAEAQGGGENTVWPHASSLSGIQKDGVSISKYACSSELNGSSGTTCSNIGTICHEFGHVLGMPDFYDTDYEENGQGFDTGPWDLMASGSYNNNQKTPPYLSAYEREMLGWTDIEILTSASAKITLPAIGTSNKGYRFNTKTNNEFFVLENRQKAGWDAHIPGHGMLIYHVDENYKGWNSNSINVNASHQAYDIEEADNIQTTGTYSGDPFPGTAHITAFTDATTPSSKSWANKDTEKPITNIREENDTIFFSFIQAISTESYSGLKAESVKVSGKISDVLGIFIEKGICYGTTTYPNATGLSMKSTENTSDFSCNLNSLIEGTNYYARAYAKDASGDYYYGNQVTFTTPSYYTVTTIQVDSIQDSYVIASGKITTNESGGPTIVEQGICFAQSSSADTSKGKVKSISGDDSFYAKGEGLIPYSTYYAKAYAIGAHGKIYYGAPISFVSPIPQSVENMTSTTKNAIPRATSANVSGEVTVIAGTASLWGICYNTKPSPTINQSRVQYSGTDKDYSCTLSNLQPNTTYYARAYVRGNIGPYYYGNEISFTTLDKEDFTLKTLDVSSNQGVIYAHGEVTVVAGELETIGFCYSDKETPTIEDSTVQASLSSTLSFNFSCPLKNLEKDSTYYVRTYAIGKNGTLIYGRSITFNSSTVNIDNQVAQDTDFSVFPNPSTGTFYVNLQSWGDKQLNITVKNLLGQSIYTCYKSITSSDFTIPLNLNHLKSGLYFLSVEGEKVQITKKIIIKK